MYRSGALLPMRCEWSGLNNGLFEAVCFRGLTRKAHVYPLPKVLSELVVCVTGCGKPLNEDLTALRHSQ
jgi:hypothetical protein